MEKGIPVMPGSSWSFHGEEVPHTPFGLKRFPLGQVLRKSLKAREESPDGFSEKNAGIRFALVRKRI